MGQQPRELTPHESLHHYWGAELRALRIARGLSLAELGQQVHSNPSYLAKIERAERPIPATLVASCDRALDASGTLVRLHALAEAQHAQATKPTHVASEDTHVASQAGNLDGEIVVPARTADGRIVFVSVPRRAFVRDIGATALGLAAAKPLPSTASSSVVSGVHPVEHFQQLRQVLIDNDALFGPRRVIPVVRQQMILIQQLRLGSRNTDMQQLARVEAQFSQFHGWLHQDAGKYELAESFLNRALALSHIANDESLTAYILSRKAHLAGDMHMPADAIGAAEQALRIAPPRSRTAVTAATFAGHGYALSGDQVAMERTYDHACELLDTVEVDPNSPCGTGWLDETYIALQRARSTTAMRDYRCAAQRFHSSIADMPSRYHRGRGVWLARAALANAGDRQVEHAATLGLDALTIGTETNSASILTELAKLERALTDWQTTPAVADFHAAMRDTVSRQA